MPSVLCYAHDSPLVIHGRRHSHIYSHPLGVSPLTSKDNTICHDSVPSPVRSFVDLSRRLRSSDAAILLATHTHTHKHRVASQIFPPDSSNVISVLHLKSVSLSVQFSAFIFNISTVSVSIYCINKSVSVLFQFQFCRSDKKCNKRLPRISKLRILPTRNCSLSGKQVFPVHLLCNCAFCPSSPHRDWKHVGNKLQKQLPLADLLPAC